MKKVAGTLKLTYSQYRELQSFAQFGSDLDADTKTRLAQGERVVEVLKQDRSSPLDVALQDVYKRQDRLDVDRLLVDRVYRGLRGSGRLDRCGRLGFDGSDGRLHRDGGLHGLYGVLNRCAAAAAERSAFLDGGAAVGTE